MTLARALCVVAGLVAGLASALWLSRTTQPVGLVDVSTIAHVVGVVGTSVVALLATAVGALMVSDWQADTQSRHDWAPLALMPTELSLAVEPAAADAIDPGYLTSASDETLRQVFRSHRATALMARSVSLSAPFAELSSTLPVREQGRHLAAASEAHASERVVRSVVGAPSRVALAVARAWKDKRRAKKIAQQFRFVANGDAWPQRRAPIYPRAGKTADVIVLSGDQADAHSSRPRLLPSPTAPKAWPVPPAAVRHGRSHVGATLRGRQPSNAAPGAQIRHRTTLSCATISDRRSRSAPPSWR